MAWTHPTVLYRGPTVLTNVLLILLLHMILKHTKYYTLGFPSLPLICYLSICGCGEALSACFRVEPNRLVCRISVTMFYGCHLHWLWAFACVPVCNLAIILATQQYVRVLGIILQAHKRRHRLQDHFRLVRIFWNSQKICKLNKILKP